MEILKKEEVLRYFDNVDTAIEFYQHTIDILKEKHTLIKEKDIFSNDFYMITVNNRGLSDAKDAFLKQCISIVEDQIKHIENILKILKD